MLSRNDASVSEYDVLVLSKSVDVLCDPAALVLSISEP
jgi:hypothetical protein